MLESNKLLIAILATLAIMCLTAIIGTVYATNVNITAFIHVNKEAVEEDNYGGDLDDARFTIDGKNYSYSFYDMIDWVYPSPDDDMNFGTLSKELTVPDNTSMICLEALPEYQSCSSIDNFQCSMVTCNQVPSDVREVHFSYPASWQVEKEE